MKLKPKWEREAVDRGADRNVGAKMTQLTSAALISHDIYCEERYTSADGSRIAFVRSAVAGTPEQLWVYDLPTRSAACLCGAILGTPTSPLDGDNLYYKRQAGADTALVRVNLATLEQDDVFSFAGCPQWRYPVCTISPDERYFVSNFRVRDELYGLYRVDLSRGTWEVFHEHADICNPHPQFEPGRGRDILIQHNRGCKLDDEGNVIKLVGPQGATLYVIDSDGGNERPLPVGQPHTSDVSGHECWVGRTGAIIVTCCRRDIRIVAPGDAAARCIMRGLRFGHIAASNDGRFFISDDMANGRLYVGSIATGRTLPLCDTNASCSWPQYTHAHAYMTPDNRHVIFNSDHTGLCQVWSAAVPDGFLDALDER